MLNPVATEKRFIELQHLLKSNLSFREKWILTCEFLSSISDAFDVYDSHCEQLAEQLPVFNHPLSVTGTDPDHFREILDTLYKLEEQLPYLVKNESYRESKTSLKVATAFLYLCLNEFSSADQIISPDLPEEGKMYDSVGDYLDQAAARLDRIQNSDSERLTAELRRWWRKANHKINDSLYVPVVEESAKKNYFGRLRQLSATVVTNSDERDIFGHSYTVLGAEGEDSGICPIVPKTARALVERDHPEIEDRYFKVQFEYKLSMGIQRGRSSELACAVTAGTSLMNYLKFRERFSLKQNIAVTGCLTETLKVGDIDVSGIKAKVSAAFFSWVTILVVPETQKHLFAEELSELQSRFRSRELTIVGLQEPEAFLYDRRLTEHTKSSFHKHLLSSAWQHKATVVSLSIIAILLTLIGMQWYGPIGKNPEIGVFKGKQLVIQNNKNQEIFSFEVGSSARAYDEKLNNSTSLKPQVQFHDINGDGINEIFYYRAPSIVNNRQPRIVAWSASGDSLIWSRNLSFSVEYPRQPAIVGNQYRLNEFYIVKTASGEAKIVASMNLETYFPSLIATLDAETGDIIQRYAHPGYFGDILPIDLTGDGNPELISTGVNNAYEKAFISALKIDSIQGHAPTEGDYIYEDMEPATHHAYLLIPKTILGQYYEAENRFNFGSEIISTVRNELIDFRIQEVRIDLFDDDIRPGIIVSVNENFDPIGIGTDDRYDLLATRLFEEGIIPFNPGFDYFEAFKDSLLYWDGNREEFSPLWVVPRK